MHSSRKLVSQSDDNLNEHEHLTNRVETKILLFLLFIFQLFDGAHNLNRKSKERHRKAGKSLH